MFTEVAYTTDGNAVVANDGTYLISYVDEIEVAEVNSYSILHDLNVLREFLDSATVKVTDPILIRRDDREDGDEDKVGIIRATLAPLDEFIHTFAKYGDFTGFAGAPAIEIIGWEPASPSEITDAMRNFFKAKRSKALLLCEEAGDPLHLFDEAV